MFKKILFFVLNTLKAPHKAVARSHGLTWVEILVTFVILSLAVGYFTNLFTRQLGFWEVTYSAFIGIIIQLVIYALYIGIALLILRALSVKVGYKNLSETFLTALIPIFIIGLLYALPIDIMETTATSVLIFNAVCVLINGFLFFLGLRGRFSISKPKSAIVAVVVTLLLFIVPWLTYQKMTEVPGGVGSLPQYLAELTH